MKLYGFANFVEQQLVPYEYASISLVVIEASMWLFFIIIMTNYTIILCTK